MRYLFRINFERSHHCNRAFWRWKCYDNALWFGDVFGDTGKSDCVRKYSTLLELKKLESLSIHIDHEKRTKIVEKYSKRNLVQRTFLSTSTAVECVTFMTHLLTLHCAVNCVTHRTSSTQRTVSIQFCVIFLIYFVAKKYYFFFIIIFLFIHSNQPPVLAIDQPYVVFVTFSSCC